MQRLLLLAALIAVFVFASSSEARSYRYYNYGSSSSPIRVNGYTRRNGTYVAPHWRSTPNYTRQDNWSTSGNYNPYTGKSGSRRYSY